MSWSIGDNGFEMTLSPQVPQVIGRDIRGLVAEAVARHGLDLADIRSWGVHPGGPRVVASVREALGLPPEAVEESEGVLREHGNMSSATILFILERLFRSAAAPPLVALAFGPGLTAEVAVFDRG